VLYQLRKRSEGDATLWAHFASPLLLLLLQLLLLLLLPGWQALHNTGHNSSRHMKEVSNEWPAVC
jgi:hypothetical protein